MNGGVYLLVVCGIVLAKGLGFFRDIVFASIFGASAQSDIYFQIFGVVNLIFTGVGLALSTLIIKNLNKAENASPEGQREYVSFFLKRVVLVMAAVTAALYLSARPLTALLLPNLSGALFDDAVLMTYIMLPSLSFVTVAYIISGVLQNRRIFFITSIISLPFNALIIGGLFLGIKNIFMIGALTTAGWFLHIIIQLPAFYRQGFRFFAKTRAALKMSSVEVWLIFASGMMFQLCITIDKAFVSADEGAIATINYSSNLFITIASVFVVAMSTVVFPAISQNYGEGKFYYVRALLRYIIVVMFAIFVPFLLSALFFGHNIIGLLYQRGEFGADTTAACAVSFSLYSLGVFGYIAQELFNKVLYLGSKYHITVSGAAGVVALKLLLDFFLAGKFGVFAAAATTAILFILYAAYVAFALGKTIGGYWDRATALAVGKTVASGMAAAAVYFLMRFALGERFFTGRWLFLAPLSVCALVYAACLWATKVTVILTKKPVTEEQQ